MKKIFLMAGVILLLTGCAKTDTNYDNEELIAEYAAGILIDHAYVNEDRYVYKVEQQPTTEKETESVTEPESEKNTEKETDNATQKEPVTKDEESTSVSVNDADIVTLLGLSGFEGNIANVIMSDSYSPDSYFSIEAEKGKIFVILEIELKNVSEQNQTINTAGKIYKIVAGEKKYNIFGTGFLNDISALNINIQPNAEYKALMVYSIDENLKDGTLTITSPAGESIKIK